jgi:hypothetical protein
MRIGLLCEGDIDLALIPALIQRIAYDQVGIRWPVRPDDVVERVGVRRGGFGQVQKAVERLCGLLGQSPFDQYDFFLIVLDQKTRKSQSAIKKCIKGISRRFVIGIAIMEIEAWWLADRRNTLEWLGLAHEPAPTHTYWAKAYRAEKDRNPKQTLDDLTKLSPTLRSTYGDGNTQLALEFSDLWNSRAELGQIRTQCPRGFAPFCQATTAALKRFHRRRS